MVGSSATFTEKTIEKNAEHFIEDTRMQVYLPNELSSGGGQLRLKIERSLLSYQEEIRSAAIAV